MMLKKSLAALAAAGALLPALVSAAPTLSILPAVQTANVGDSVTVTVQISGLQAIDEVVAAFDLNVLYDPSLLFWSVIDAGPGIDAMGGIGNVVSGFDGTNGAVGADVTSLLTSDDDLVPLQTDPQVLLQFTFAALADGAAYLNFGPDSDFQRLVVGRGFSPLDLVYTGACIAIGDSVCRQVDVPEPGTYGLVAAALLGAFATTRRRRSGSFT